MPNPPVFSRLFTQPTGQNGYEDWVQAGDAIRNNPMVNQAMAGDATLTFKRHLLNAPDVQTALHLLREGLNKPIQSPHLMPDNSTVFPEMAPLRRLARLLAIEIYVRFADGSTDAALDSLQDGLRFGCQMQTNTLISGLAGVAIDTIVLEAFSGHLEQLSVHQCSRLRHIVEEWVDRPFPVAALLDTAQQLSLRSLEAKRSNPQALKDLLDQFATDDSNAPVAQARIGRLTPYLDSQPADLGPVIDHAEALIHAYYDAALVNLNQPLRERRPMTVVSDKSLGGDLFASLVVNADRITDKYDRIEAMLRMLGVHAVIRGYRWEHNVLPNTLADLHLGRLSVDPFTGGDLVYQRVGKSYDLTSRGPFERDESGQPTVRPPPLKLFPTD